MKAGKKRKECAGIRTVARIAAGVLGMLWLPCSMPAQDTVPGEGNVLDGLHMVGRDQEKAVLLRWAAGSYDLWMTAMRNGFVLERYAFDTASLRSAPAYSDSLPPPLLQSVRISPFLEQDTALLGQLAGKDDYAALLGEAVFSPRIQFTLGGGGASPWKAVSERLQEKMIRFTLANLAYDRSFPVACLGTMGYRDTTVQPGFYYLYRVYVDSSFAGNDTALYFSRLENFALMPPLQVLQTDFKEGVAELSWQEGFGQGLYTGYFIERAEGEDPQPEDYVRLNDVPYTALQEAKGRSMVYRDSLPSNRRPYSYRLLGRDLFGQESLLAKSHAGQGKEFLRAMPAIDSVYAVDSRNLAIAWSFPEEQADRMERQELYVTSSPYQQPGPAHLVEVKAGKKGEHVFLMRLSDLESNSSYFHLRAIGRHGESRMSLPFFYQRVDSVPPFVPGGLAYTVDEKARIRLSWNASQEEDLLGYRVFLSNAETGEPVQLTSSLLRDTVFFDTLSLGTAQYFYYRVAAEDRTGNMSGFSEALAVKNLRPRKPAPALFALQHCRRYPDRVKLVWYTGRSPYLKGFRLYHKSDTTEWVAVADFPVPGAGGLADTAAFLFEYPASTLPGLQLFNVVAYGEGEEDTAHAPFLFEARYSPVAKAPSLELFADRENRLVQVEWKNPEHKAVKRVYLYRASETEPLRLLAALDGKPGSRQVYMDQKVKMNTYYQYRLQLEFADGSWGGYSGLYGIEY